MSELAAAPHGGRRPGEVWAVSILLVVFGLIGVPITGAQLFSLFREDITGGEPVSLAVIGLAAAAFAWMVALLISGVFVFVGRNWARLLAVAPCVLNALAGLSWFAFGSILQLSVETRIQALVFMAVNIVLIGTLTKRKVSSWFTQPASPDARADPAFRDGAPDPHAGGRGAGHGDPRPDLDRHEG